MSACGADYDSEAASGDRSTISPRGEQTSPGEAMPRSEGEDLRRELNTTDLTVTLAGPPTPASAGEDLAYTVTVTNRGPNPASSTTVAVALQGPARWLRQDPACRPDGPERLTCELGEVMAQAVRTLALTAGPIGELGVVRISATVENRLGPDSNGSDNTTNVETPVR